MTPRRPSRLRETSLCPLIGSCSPWRHTRRPRTMRSTRATSRFNSSSTTSRDSRRTGKPPLPRSSTWKRLIPGFRTRNSEPILSLLVSKTTAKPNQTVSPQFFSDTLASRAPFTTFLLRTPRKPGRGLTSWRRSRASSGRTSTAKSWTCWTGSRRRRRHSRRSWPS